MPIVLDPPEVTYGSGDPDRYLPGSGVAIPTTVLDTTYEYNGFAFNNRDALDHYFIKKFDGLTDAEVRRSEESNPDRHGMTFFGALYDGKPMSLEGYCLAHTLDKLEDMWFALRNAFDRIDTELPLIGRTDNFDRDWQIYCAKSGQIAWEDEQTSYEFKRVFMIPLKATDPRIYSVRQRLASVSLPVSNANTNLTVRHLGNWREATFKLTLVGRQSNVAVTNGATGQVFVLNGLIPAGSTYTIDFDEGTIEDQNGVNRFDQYDHTSDWLHLAPQVDNVLTIASINRDATAVASVNWVDQYR
jgi:hypothetical protein